jgi:hypothetical protein
MKHKPCLVFPVLLLAFGAAHAQPPFKVGLALDSPPQISGNCHPTRVHFSGRLNATAPGVAQYQFVRSDKANAPVRTMKFAKPGPQIVTYDWMISKTFNGWVALKLVSPMTAETHHVEFQVSCR